MSDSNNIKKKFALGIHHLNIAYNAGDIPSYHRQVREAIVPFLDLLYRHPSWCFSVEICGFSIEFIGENYPSVLDRFKFLVDRNQIELISCTYAPQIWINFPIHDMIKSIHFNQEILAKYQLPNTRIFFTQENFSGEGIKRFSHWFDVVVVKDDYYFYFNEMESEIKPYYSFDELKLMIGWGHILETLLDKYYNDIGYREEGFSNLLYHSYKPYIDEFESRSTTDNKYTKPQSKYKSIEWSWYHIGSSERFAKPSNKPENIITCKFDPLWFFCLEGLLESYEKNNYTISGINEFLKHIKDESFIPEPARHLLDGSWNMEKSRGGYVWTGNNTSKFQDDILIRNHNWYSRSKLVAAEALFNYYSDKLVNTESYLLRFDQAWKKQILAESSDSTGWNPNRSEVMYSIDKSEETLNLVCGIVNNIKTELGLGLVLVDVSNRIVDDYPQIDRKITKESLVNPFIKIYSESVECMIGYYDVNSQTQEIHVDLKPFSNADVAGVFFKFAGHILLYSPALMDFELVEIDLNSYDLDEIFLPLPNGLVGITENTFIIKHNSCVNISCCIKIRENKVCFFITNPNRYNMKWVFTVFKGCKTDAIKLANLINISPKVLL